MRRTITGAVLLLAATTSMTGCGMFKKQGLARAVEYHFEVTGATTDKISYATAGEHGDLSSQDVAAPALPWKIAGVAYPGAIKVELTPKDGPATCRIIVEKKELAKKRGQPGAPLTCEATVKE